jgi:probable phosphoglycerate mutase
MTSHPQPFFNPPAGACQIVLIRHGQSVPFVEGQPFPLVDGHGDPALSPRGEMQAERVGDRLAGEPIDAIYVSSLTRTHQTAAPLASRLSIEPAVDADLREVFLGEFEGGLLRQKFAEGHPAAADFRATGEWGVIPGAETTAQLTQRTTAAVQRIAANHANQMVAVVCHGGVISALLSHAAGVGPRVFPSVRNGSLSHIVVQGSNWILRSFNDAAHTGSLGADHDPAG